MPLKITPLGRGTTRYTHRSSTPPPSPGPADPCPYARCRFSNPFRTGFPPLHSPPQPPPPSLSPPPGSQRRGSPELIVSRVDRTPAKEQRYWCKGLEEWRDFKPQGDACNMVGCKVWGKVKGSIEKVKKKVEVMRMPEQERRREERKGKIGEPWGFRKLP